jgi:hypothetical protein
MAIDPGKNIGYVVGGGLKKSQHPADRSFP